jgi:ribose 5-phosphate isomerase A
VHLLVTADELKRAAAQAALAEVQPGMLLGLGTGSTAWHFVDLLGARVAEGLDARCVPTSERTAEQARGLGITLTDLDTDPLLDLTVDGADEIGPGLALIKGAGGALLREKIVASASRRMVVIADAAKRVGALGSFPLPIEVNPFGIGATRLRVEAVMREHGAAGELVLRRGSNREPFVTDGGHLILDAFFGRISSPEAVSRALLDIPGIVQHGLFLGLCNRAYVAGPEGVAIIDA